MADYQQNFLASLQGGLNFGQQIKAQRDNNALNQLAGQAYAAPQEQRQALIGQAMGIDRRAGAQLEQQAVSSDEQRNRTMVNMAKLITSAPEQARPQLWQRFIPTLSQYGMSELPQEYNAQTAPIINQAAQSLVQAYSGGLGSGGTLQSQRVLEDGSILNTYRDGRTENTGLKADRRQWFRDQPGFEPEIINADGTITSIGGTPAPARGGQGVNVGQGVGAVRMNIEGIPAEQQQRMAQTVSLMRQAGYPENEIDAFVAGQLPTDVPGLPQAGSTPMSRARPTAAQDAMATEMARQQVQQRFLPDELAMRTQAALAQEAGKAQVTAQADANKLQTTRARDANTALDLLDEAETLLNGGATGSLIGAGVDRLAGAVGQSTRGAQATAALRTIAGQLTSKMPRMEGPQSDKDVQLYKEMAGDLANDALPVPTRVAALRQIRELNSKYANRQDRPSAPRQIQSAAEYNALPTGALFIAPDGTQRRKR